MSIPLLLAVWNLELQGTEKLVLMGLADSANRAAVCWPCMGTLAKKCGISKATARRAVASLEEKKLIFRDYRTGHSNKYHIKVTPIKMSGVKYHPQSKPAPPLSNRVDYPTQIECQNLLPEPVNNLRDFSIKKEDQEVTPELREMLDNLYESMKA